VGTHLILPMRPTGPQGPIYATAKKDGRPFFLLPWDGRLLVGTTDVKFTGDDPDKLEMEAWEVDYLIAETNNLFPNARYTNRTFRRSRSVSVPCLRATRRRVP
jgi:glycerol-3-phosphate dehydrogenase